MKTTVIEGRHERAAVLTGQKMPISTIDMLELFIDKDVIDRIEACAKKKPGAVLAKNDMLAIKYGLFSMANTMIGISQQLPKQRIRKDDNVKGACTTAPTVSAAPGWFMTRSPL